MWLHAEVCCEVSVAAGALIEVAAFRADNTQITLGEFLKAGVTITLAEAFFTGAAALKTFDGAQVFKGDLLAYVFIQGVSFVVQPKRILNRVLGVAAACW